MGSRVLDVGDTGPSSSTLQLTQFKPAGINSLASRPNAYNALDFVMGALRATHPHMLEELRDVTGEEGVIQCAADYRFNSHLVVDFLIEQWGRWKRNPEEAKALIFRQYFHQIVVPPPGDDDWVRSHLHHVNLPNPSVETVTEWLTRARKLYDDRASIRHTKRKPRFSRWDDFARHCHWFVQVQMLGQSPSKVARLAMIDRAAIERGTLAIAKLLNLPRRRWPRGRHSQM